MYYYQKFSVVALLVLTLLFAGVAQAAPGLQQGEGTATDDSGQQDDGDDGTSLGDTLDLTLVKPNLGTIMSNQGQSGADTSSNDEPADPVGADDDAASGDVAPGDGTNPADDDTVNSDNNTDETVTKAHPVATAIADFFDVPVEEVTMLHNTGSGFGNIAKAYFFSTVIDATPEQLLTEAKSVGWGNMLKQNGLHPGAVGHGVAKDTSDPATTGGKQSQANQGGSANFTGPGASPGNSGNAPGHSNGHGADKDKAVGPKADQGNHNNNGQANGHNKDKNKGKGKK